MTILSFMGAVCIRRSPAPWSVLIARAILLAGYSLAPNYHKLTESLPEAYRDESPTTTATVPKLKSRFWPDYLPLLQTHTTLYSTNDQLLQVRGGRLGASVALYKALGGDVAPSKMRRAAPEDLHPEAAAGQK